MNSSDVQAWLDRYLEAWRSYQPEMIRSLFNDDATYAFHPWDEPLRGATAIAENWLADQDAPGSWEAAYRPAMVEGNKAMATGKTSYSNGRVYWNMWELEFDEQGRCSRFVEWFMRQPS